MSTAPLGLIAGGGSLPEAVAQSVTADGGEVFVVALTGAAEPRMEVFPHAWVGLGEAGKAIKALKTAGCQNVLMAGKLQRPDFSQLKLDFKGVRLVPRLIRAAAKGDNALLDAVSGIFRDEGFSVIGIAEAAPGLLAPDGVIGGISPQEDDLADARKAFAIVRALGALDVGQAAVVASGLPLAVEAAEGTDAMLSRIPQLPSHFRGSAEKRRGVLVKAIKPIQDGSTDLPVIGLQTLRGAAAAGLSGIVVETGRALILDRPELIFEADRLGLFIMGMSV